MNARKKKKLTLEHLGFLTVGSLLQLSCSSPQKTEGNGQKPEANADAISLTLPVEYAEELNDGNDTPVKLVSARKNRVEDPLLSEPAAAAEKTAEKSGARVAAATVDRFRDKQINRSPASKDAKVVVYVVKTGDTLMKISFNLLGDLTRWQEIYQDNQSLVTNPNVLTKGTRLNVRVFDTVTVKRNGEAYPIKRGDTLAKISNWAYGTLLRWKEIWKNNRELIHNPNKIYAGFRLFYVKDKNKEALEPNVRPASVPEKKQ